jgi:hypothetical protein
MEEELGLSYPTLRNRFNEILRVMALKNKPKKKKKKS